MTTQFDYQKRVVSLENLKAMCAHISGTAHTYQVSRVTPSRVYVEYSNPDEWANDDPMTAVFPLYQSPFDKDNPAVVLSFLTIQHDTWDGEGWQAFTGLLDCPTLWRNPATGEWETH